MVNVFMFAEPLGCWQRASVRERKTAVDWAEEVRRLLEVDYPHTEKVRLVCDNLTRIVTVRYMKHLLLNLRFH